MYFFSLCTSDYLEMLARLADILTGTRRRINPSIVLVLRRPHSTSLLHIVPETGDVECVKYTSPAFTHRGTTERSREQIGTVSLYDTKHDVDEFLKEISTRATKILSGHETLSAGSDSVLPIEQALRSAVSESLESRSGHSRKTGNQSFPIFLVHIDRPKPGQILTDDDLTSSPK